jgi:predicted TIM-barrel fold metal-dependent hydrolase
MNYDGPIIDVDVHHSAASPAELIAYLPERWQKLLRNSSIAIKPGNRHLTPPGATNARLDSYPEEGGQPGSSLKLMRQQLLDPMRIERCLLTFNTGMEVAHENVAMSVASMTALNNWTVERWLSGQDDRFYGLVLLCSYDPQAAAAEIRRLATNQRMAGALLVDSGIGPPFGHPVYHPIYEAAAECGMPVAIHFGLSYMSGHLPQATAGGNPMNFFEYYTLNHQAGQHHVVSFITHGVFEKWPSLKLVMLEDGFVWAPWLFEHLDSQYRRLKLESPWVERLPSEYLRDNIRFSTQPYEYDPGLSTDHFVDLLELFPDISRVLMFASDYPHWDTDQAEFVGRHLPREWHQRVFYYNASETFRWPKELPNVAHPEPTASSAALQAAVAADIKPRVRR